MLHLGPTEIILILFLIILFFGAGRIAPLTGEIGKSIRAFRTGISRKSKTDKSHDQDQNA